jgi:1-phosphatidylinositol-4-phosphate 5-kinase
MASAIQELPTIDSTDRRHFLFYQDEGGLRATDEGNQAMDIIYYLGVIDILTPYNTTKRLEHLWRGTTIDRVRSTGHIFAFPNLPTVFCSI